MDTLLLDQIGSDLWNQASRIPPSTIIADNSSEGVSYDHSNKQIITERCRVTNVSLGTLEEVGYDSISGWYNLKSEESDVGDGPKVRRISDYSYLYRDSDESFSWHSNVPVEIDSGHYNVGFRAKFVKVNTQWTIRYDEICQLVPEHIPAPNIGQIIKHRMAPVFMKRHGIGQAENEAELAARETLKKIIGDAKFRRFLKHGHISVKAKSGLVYQLFSGSRHAQVYENGKCIESVCVVLDGDFPPTDSLIMRYLLILNDEQDFRKIANISRHTLSTTCNFAADNRLLVDIYQEIKSRPLSKYYLTIPELEVA